MRRHADAVDLLVVDADRVNLVAIKQRVHQITRWDALNADSADRAREPRIQRRMQLHPGNVFHPRRPVVLQIKNALLLTLRSNRLMEIDRLSNALLDGEAARSQRLKLTNIAAARISITGQRPDLLDLVLLHPHHARANRRRQKLMQARPKVIAM